MPVLTNKDELLRFLGMAKYLIKFVPNFSAKIQPLQELLKSEVAWHWKPGMTDTFHEIKPTRTTVPMLHYLTQPSLSINASSYGIGSVLLRNGPPVAYASAPLTPAQPRYAHIEKDLLVVVFASVQLY